MIEPSITWLAMGGVIAAVLEESKGQLMTPAQFEEICVQRAHNILAEEAV